MLETPKQAFATREAYEALLELKSIIDDAAKLTHAAELESFHVAFNRDQDDDVRRSLQNVIERVKSQNFDRAVVVAREKLEIALSF